MQRWYSSDPSAERFDFGESVSLTAVVRGGDRLTHSDIQIARHELPRGDFLRRVQLGVELREGDVALFGATPSARVRGLRRPAARGVLCRGTSQSAAADAAVSPRSKYNGRVVSAHDLDFY
jgi:hypothetical protein